VQNDYFQHTLIVLLNEKKNSQCASGYMCMQPASCFISWQTSGFVYIAVDERFCVVLQYWR